jgi:hypothetical protein
MVHPVPTSWEDAGDDGEGSDDLLEEATAERAAELEKGVKRVTLTVSENSVHVSRPRSD